MTNRKLFQAIVVMGAAMGASACQRDPLRPLSADAHPATPMDASAPADLTAPPMPDLLCLSDAGPCTDTYLKDCPWVVCIQ